MAVNDRIVYTSNDIDHGQQSPAQANRTQFYPGKAMSRAGDMTWEKDFRTPQGTPAFSRESAGPVEMARTRIVKLHRGSVCDQTVLVPVVNDVRVEAVAETGVSGTNVTVDTNNPPNTSERERRAGNDRIAGA